MKQNIMNNKIKALVMASIIIGAVGMGYSIIYNTKIVAMDNSIPIPLTAVNTIQQQHPNAVVIQGQAQTTLSDVPLRQIAEISEGLRPDLSGEPSVIKANPGLIMQMHYGNKGLDDVVAVTLINSSPNPISVDVFVISGYLHGEVPESYVESVYRPIISDETDVAKATTTVPKVILPGKSITSYIQDVLNADGYRAMACYSSDTKDLSTHFCTTLPITWLR